jgi:hypothetical protein
MGVGALFMTIFALDLFGSRPVRDMIAGAVATGLIVGLIWRGFPAAGFGALFRGR